MALSKVDYNSLNVTAAASKAIKWNSTPNGFETGDIAGALVLLATETASSSATVTFDSNIDSTYKEYQIQFIDVHPATDTQPLTMNFRDGSTAYDATKTTTFFYASHDEADTATSLTYVTGGDIAQGTGVQNVSVNVGNGNDESCSGIINIYDPSNTTFVKHFTVRSNTYNSSDASYDLFVAGYSNHTAALDGGQFKFASGDIDAGTIKLYGVT